MDMSAVPRPFHPPPSRVTAVGLARFFGRMLEKRITDQGGREGSAASEASEEREGAHRARQE